jgi:hypothetical protein
VSPSSHGCHFDEATSHLDLAPRPCSRRHFVGAAAPASSWRTHYLRAARSAQRAGFIGAVREHGRSLAVRDYRGCPDIDRRFDGRKRVEARSTSSRATPRERTRIGTVLSAEVLFRNSSRVGPARGATSFGHCSLVGTGHEIVRSLRRPHGLTVAPRVRRGRNTAEPFRVVTRNYRKTATWL